MPPLAPVSRGDFIKSFRNMGFEGPIPGSDHEYMQRADLLVKIPNPHRGDISVPLLTRILRNAGVSREDWNAART